jgi:hypothetical protein
MRPAGNEAGASSLDPPARKAAEGFSFVDPSGCLARHVAPAPWQLGLEVLQMSISQQSAAGRSPAFEGSCARDGAPLLAALIGCGRRDAPAGAAMTALVVYWRALATGGPAGRQWLMEGLRQGVRRGETTARAWLPVVLGETDPGLVAAGVTGYLGGTLASLEHRERALADVCDWIARGLPINRVAVFVAMLAQRDPALPQRLADLRGRLADEEARAVWAAADCGEPATAEFLAEWQAVLAAG